MKDKITAWEVTFIVQMVNKKTHYKYICNLLCFIYIYAYLIPSRCIQVTTNTPFDYSVTQPPGAGGLAINTGKAITTERAYRCSHR